MIRAAAAPRGRARCYRTNTHPCRRGSKAIEFLITHGRTNREHDLRNSTSTHPIQLIRVHEVRLRSVPQCAPTRLEQLADPWPLPFDNRDQIENPRAVPNTSAGGGSFAGGSCCSALDDVETNLGLLSTLPVPSGRQLPCTRWIYAYRAPSTICYSKSMISARLKSSFAAPRHGRPPPLQFFAIAAVERYACPALAP